MSDKHLPAIGGTTFEEFKQTNEHGAEYWSARNLQPLLGYSQWRRFEQTIERAIISCQQSGNRPDYHFAGVSKMVDLDSGSQRKLEDYQLSRFACYRHRTGSGMTYHRHLASADFRHQSEFQTPRIRGN